MGQPSGKPPEAGEITRWYDLSCTHQEIGKLAFYGPAQTTSCTHMYVQDMPSGLGLGSTRVHTPEDQVGVSPVSAGTAACRGPQSSLAWPLSGSRAIPTIERRRSGQFGHSAELRLSVTICRLCKREGALSAPVRFRVLAAKAA